MNMFDKIYQYNFPTRIRFGAGAMLEVAPHLKQEGFSRPLVVTDPVVKDLPFFKQLLASLESQGLKPLVPHFDMNDATQIIKKPVPSRVHSFNDDATQLILPRSDLKVSSE